MTANSFPLKPQRQVMGMSLDYEVAPMGMAQAEWDKLHIADWVNLLAPWQVISHLTFAWQASFDSGRRVYEKFMKRHLPTVSYFYALEQNPSRDGCHVHALWASSSTVFRKGVWGVWKERYGRARIEPVRGHQDVSSYCAKYVTKERAWYDVRLKGSVRYRYESLIRGEGAKPAEPALDLTPSLPYNAPEGEGRGKTTPCGI